MAILEFNSNTKKVKLKLGIYDDVAATFTPVSSELTLRYDQQCSRFPVHLTWLNNLGNWEHFVFKAEQTFKTEFKNSNLARKSNFDNWDNSFTSDETQDFYYNIEAFEGLLITSQLVEEDYAKTIAQIKESIQVQRIFSDLSKRTVIVDKESFEYFTDNEKLTQIQFEIRYSDELPIQNQ